MKLRKFVKPFRVADGTHFRLNHFDPADTLEFKSKEHARKALERGVARLAELQEKLYAQDRWAILVILQGMDAAGKDSTIKHVMSGVNPEGCSVISYKTPSVEELNHDFLWRTTRSLPQRGTIGIFNRSYYEEVLVVRVHPELLGEGENAGWSGFEQSLAGTFRGCQWVSNATLSGTASVVLKFFLNLSKKGTKSAVPGTPGRTGKELEIFHFRRSGTQALG